MNHADRFPNDKCDELPPEVLELGRKITAMAPSRQQVELELAYLRVAESIQRRRRILNLVQEALAQLRLDIKYLMFDLDVTRQERDELRKQLEGN